MATIRSRIMEFIPPALQDELEALCKNPIISDNNIKVDGMLALLNKYNIDAIELGPGTNRLAVLIDNYVFKIALDKWGQQDNANEFALSHELQPFVIKTYELSANHVLTVCEYVTVISREEFIEQADVLRDNLAVLAETYLLGDVGTVPKNFTNWGYRDNDDLVILDYAYIYPVKGSELLCSHDQTILDYDKNFHSLYCPTCSRKYSSSDVRRKITMEQENREQQLTISQSYKLTSPVQEFKENKSRYSESDETDTVDDSAHTEQSVYSNKEGNIMTQRYDDNQEEKYVTSEDAYESKLDELEKRFRNNNTIEEAVEILDSHEVGEKHRETEVNVVEIERQTETERTAIRIISEKAIDGEEAGDVIDKGLQVAHETAETLEETSNWSQLAAFASNQLPEAEEHEPDNYGQIAQDVHDGKVDYNEDTDEEDNDDDTSEEFDENKTDVDETDSEPLEGVVVSTTDSDESTVVFRNETQVTDSIVIRNEIEVREHDGSDASAVQKLRDSLRGDIEVHQETDVTSKSRAEELAEGYEHLEDEDDSSRRRQNNKDWDN